MSYPNYSSVHLALRSNPDKIAPLPPPQTCQENGLNLPAPCSGPVPNVYLWNMKLGLENILPTLSLIFKGEGGESAKFGLDFQLDFQNGANFWGHPIHTHAASPHLVTRQYQCQYHQIPSLALLLTSSNLQCIH